MITVKYFAVCDNKFDILVSPGITLGCFSGAASSDASLGQNFHPAYPFANQNSTLLALFLIKILPCLWIFWLKPGHLFFPDIFLPWLCFSFKISFLIFVFILKVLFPFFLFYFYFIFSFSLVALTICFRFAKYC